MGQAALERTRCASGAPVRSSGSGRTDGENPGIAHHTHRSGKATKTGAETRRVREILFDRSGARASWRIAGIHLSSWRTAVALVIPRNLRVWHGDVGASTCPNFGDSKQTGG